MPGPEGGPSDYNPLAYIDRTIVIRSILGWMHTPRKKCLQVVIAPPGSGKSWMLAHLKQDLDQLNQYPVFYIVEARKYIINDGGALIPYDTRIKEWVRECYQTAARFYPGKIPKFNYANHYTQSITLLANALRQNVDKPGLRALLLVDGFDEIGQGTAREDEIIEIQKIFSREVLLPFTLGNDPAAATRDNLRIELTQRDRSASHCAEIKFKM